VITDKPLQTKRQPPAAAHRDEELSELLDVLRDRASRPLEEAKALPPAFYTSKALYELEIERIWRRSWIHVGRVEELAAPGDYIKRDIGGEPIVIARGRDGEIRALSRVCQHRFMDVLDGAPDQGNTGAFACPYHKWTYALDGTLQGAAHMGQSELFQRQRAEICLPRFQTTTWQGFLFVNLDPDAAPLSDVMDHVESKMGNYHGEEWRLVDRIKWGDTPANWKLVVDNGREAYHHIGTHLESLQPLWPAHLVDFEPLDTADFFFARMFVSPEAAIGQEDGHYLNPLLLPLAPNLTAFERSNYIVAGIYPGFILVPGPDAMLTISFVPTGPSSHYVELDILAHETGLDDPDLEEKVKQYHDWLVQIQGEDAAAQVAVQRALSSRLTLEGGPLSHLERAIWTFQRYLGQRLLDR
jgi:phenylpropionate dioxygenase-like ring-hydroxylating dioxygenase large terminal subunit